VNDQTGSPGPQRVLVVCAHPDDPEFSCGATVARLVDEGADAAYVVCTDGAQGGEDPSVPDSELTSVRYQEQLEAAAVLGVHQVQFLGYKDGQLTADLGLRKALVREIRRHRPDIVITQSPLRRLRTKGIGAFHPDHQAVGEATLQAVYPDARNPRAFRELLDEDLPAHTVKEVWIATYDEGEHVVDVEPYVDLKLKALRCHQSQLGKLDFDEFESWLRQYMHATGERNGLAYAEAFTRLDTVSH
jgi:LmbE family N-acetylglucosaminyl deacetylase